MNIENIRKVIAINSELVKISHKLHKQDENACNYGLTPRQEKMVETLETRANSLAKSLGLIAYHQGDPRGCSLYLIDDTMNDTNYHNGIAIY